MRQILLNLAGNGVKFTEKGHVFLHASLVEETDTMALLRFEVSDTGVGIPKDRLNSIFDSFSQADASTTRRFGGTGLGLSISKQLVEMMGGKIGVRSILGQGATFWFTCRFEKQRAPLAPPLPKGGDIAGKRVLIVDDSPINRLVLRKQLAGFGCLTEEVPSAAVALDALHEAASHGRAFDAAVLDMMMPEMDGEELGHTIKEDDGLHDTVLVMLTSVGRRGDAARLRAAGFAAYLSKPVKESALRDCLLQVLSGEGDPLAKEASHLATAHSLAESRRRGIRILLVEDNLVNQRVALKMLEKLGYSASVANNGREALEAVRKEAYDIIFMDMQMPEMDGRTATGRIRALERASGRHTPIIAMTAHAMQGDREACLSAGMDDYVSKPIKAQDIVDALERNLPASSAEALPSVKLPALMQRFAGDEKLLQEAATLFRDEISGQQTRLREALDVLSEDPAAISEILQAAKKIAEAAYSMQAPALQFLAQEIESAAHEGAGSTLDCLAERVGEELARFQQALSLPAEK